MITSGNPCLAYKTKTLGGTLQQCTGWMRPYGALLRCDTCWRRVEPDLEVY